MTKSGKQSDEILKTVGPNSLMWKLFGDSRCVFVIAQSFVLQISHPVIDSAVETQSSYKEDPWGRAERSFKYLWPVVYSPADKAREAGRFLRQWHKNIKGVDKYGKAYDAFGVEAYAWVHLTAYDAMVRLAHWINNRPLDESELNQLFSEWRDIGLLLGCDESSLPQSKESYWLIFNQMIDERLEYTDSVNYWLSKDFIRYLHKPSKLIPEVLWCLCKPKAAALLDLIIRASLPERFRQKFNISLTKQEKKRFYRLIKLFNFIWPLLPLRFQYVPYAYDSVKASRKSPDLFV